MTSLRIGTRISGPVGRPQQLRAAVRPPTAGRRVRVAAIEQPLDSAYSEPESSALSELSSGDAAVDEGVQLQQLDEAQEGLLKWMLFLDGEDQAADLEADLDADEVADRPDDEFAAILDEVEGLLEEGEGSFKPGDKVFGTVYEVDEDGAYVEIGSKTAGFVPLVECSLGRLKSPLEVLRPGMKREFVVVEDEDEYEEVILSLAAIEATVFWQRARQMQEEGVPVMVTVMAANNGGLLVQYAHLEGFIPTSHLGGNITAENMEAFIGFELPAKFLEIDEEGERLVFSHRRASSSADMQGYKVGDVVLGTVQSVRPYGAFVDIGGAIGLLHISQITAERLTTVDQVLAEGDKLKVMILSQDSDRGRVTLSTKKLEDEPGDMLRDPQKVFENAERKAEEFKARVAAADPAALGGAYYEEGAYAEGGYPPAEGGYAAAPLGGAEQAASFDV